MPITYQTHSAQVSAFDAAGVRVRKVFSKKRYGKDFRNAAESFFSELLIENSGTQTAQQAKIVRKARQITFGELAQRYIDEHLIPHTRSAENGAYVKTLIMKWGEYRIAQITQAGFREWVRYALDHPIPTAGSPKGRRLAAKTVQHLITYGVRVLNWGIEQGIIAHNPLEKVKDTILKKEMRRRTKQRHEVLSVEDFTAMVRGWPDYVKLPSILAFYSGLRRGEVVGVRWDMVDRKRMCIHFEADQVKDSDAKTVFYDSEADQVFEQLEIERLTSGVRDCHVFRNKAGAPLSVGSFAKSLKYYLDGYATETNEDRYRSMGCHTFRRSYRTRKSMEGVDAKAVAANMGHHSLTMSDHYDISSLERQRSVIGNAQIIDERVLHAVSAAVDAAQQCGITLQDVQSVVRREWMQKRSPVAGK